MNAYQIYKIVDHDCARDARPVSFMRTPTYCVIEYECPVCGRRWEVIVVEHDPMIRRATDKSDYQQQIREKNRL